MVSLCLQECIYWCQYVFKSAHPCVTMSLKLYILVPLYVTVYYNNTLYGTAWYFMVLYDTLYYCILGGVFMKLWPLPIVCINSDMYDLYSWSYIH